MASGSDASWMWHEKIWTTRERCLMPSSPRTWWTRSASVEQASGRRASCDERSAEGPEPSSTWYDCMLRYCVLPPVFSPGTVFVVCPKIEIDLFRYICISAPHAMSGAPTGQTRAAPNAKVG